MRVIERLTAVQIQLRSTLSTQICGLKPQPQPRPIPVLRREPAKSLYRKRPAHPCHITPNLPIQLLDFAGVRFLLP